MDRSSPTLPPVDYSEAPSVHPPAAGNEPEVQALNKSLRKDEPEKMLPDNQGKADRYQSKCLVSFRVSQHCSPGVSVSQKHSEFTGNKHAPSGQPHTETNPATEKSRQAFESKRLLFEQKIAEPQRNILSGDRYTSSHSSIHDYQPGKVRKENEWMQNAHHYSQHSPAPWEQEFKNIIQNPTASADLNTPRYSQQYQEATTTKRQQKAPPPPPPERKSLLPSPAQHLEAATTTKEHAHTHPDKREKQAQRLQNAIEVLNELFEQLGTTQKNDSV